MQFVYYECKDEVGMTSEVALMYTKKVDNKLRDAYIIALICNNTTSFQWHQSNSKLKWKIFLVDIPVNAADIAGQWTVFQYTDALNIACIR